MGSIYLIVDDPKSWDLDLPNVTVVRGLDYLTDSAYAAARGARVFNLCRSYRYQSVGYYVTLLATARGHRSFPGLQAMQDLTSTSVARSVSDELASLINKSLAHIQSDRFTLSIYFGRNVAKHYDRLALHLFNTFQAPLLRAKFARSSDGEWEMRSIRPVPFDDVNPEHRPAIEQFAREHLERARPASVGRKKPPRYWIGILYDSGEEHGPSDDKAIERFQRAATKLEIGTEILGRDDIGRLAEYDGLFIRETTNVLHHTYRFARRAVAEDMVVIDDPLSILKCTNKVYQHELLTRHHIPTPPTSILARGGDRAAALENVGLPCVLKQPDSAFSQGVHRAMTVEEYNSLLDQLFETSELVVLQGFVESEFDWRIGILDQKPLYACKYFMAPKHWQIQQTLASGKTNYGKWETVPVEVAPRKVVRTALAAANLVGDGLYGVDLKMRGNEVCVMEINDNPSIESSVEDAILKEDLYMRIMTVFLQRMEAKRSSRQ